jgi:hypothetical protein
MMQSSDDQRRDEVLKRMLQTPPKKQAELKKDLAEKRRMPKPKRHWQG